MSLGQHRAKDADLQEVAVARALRARGLGSLLRFGELQVAAFGFATRDHQAALHQTVSRLRKGGYVIRNVRGLGYVLVAYPALNLDPGKRPRAKPRGKLVARAICTVCEAVRVWPMRDVLTWNDADFVRYERHCTMPMLPLPNAMAYRTHRGTRYSEDAATLAARDASWRETTFKKYIAAERAKVEAFMVDEGITFVEAVDRVLSSGQEKIAAHAKAERREGVPF